ncbi:Dual specificity phosphatase [Pelomyxa schiedti]|nr:Dual specificity phosphatase [Pelomyxa schiedti]
MAQQDNSWKMQEVVRGLFLGGYSAASDWDLLRSKGVTHVLSVMEGAQMLIDPMRERGIVHKIVAVLDWDTEDLKKHFHECIKFIDNGLREGCVLVHCGAGISRSSTIVIAYIMWKSRIPFETALAQVTAIRPIVYPNAGFTKQLCEYQEELKNPWHDDDI